MAIFKSRKNGAEFDIQIESIEFDKDVMRIYWCGDCGWGEYRIFANENGKFAIDSEMMDSANKKDFRFLETLFRAFIEECDIVDV